LLIPFKDVVKAEIHPLQHIRGEVFLSTLQAHPSLDIPQYQQVIAAARRFGVRVVVFIVVSLLWLIGSTAAPIEAPIEA
jgi:hypothetical protein